MSLLLGIMIGIGIGAAAVYFLLKPKLAHYEQTLKQTRKTLEDREKVFKSRLQANPQQQLALKTEELRQQDQSSPSSVALPSDPHLTSPATDEPLAAIQSEHPDPLSPEPPLPEPERRLAATEYEPMSVPIVVAEPSPTAPSPTASSPATPKTGDRPLPLQSLASSQNEAKTMVAWGYSGGIQHIPLLISYAYNSDGHLRGLAASALGQIAASQPMRVEFQRAIPVLEKLSRDSDSSVRRAAVEALGKFSSEKVISPLKLALRDVDPDVVKSASEAIATFKFYRVNRLAKAIKPKPLNRK